MPLRLDDKRKVVAEVNAIAATAHSAVIADYLGVKVSDLTQLRDEARKEQVYLRVVRNTLLKRAVEGTDFACIDSACVGPTLVAFSLEEVGASARVLKAFGKKHEKFTIRALAVGGEMLDGSKIDVLANLPTHDEALAQLMSVMLAPVTKLAQTLNDVPGQVTRVVAAVRDQKQQAN